MLAGVCGSIAKADNPPPLHARSRMPHPYTCACISLRLTTDAILRVSCRGCDRPWPWIRIFSSSRPVRRQRGHTRDRRPRGSPRNGNKPLPSRGSFAEPGTHTIPESSLESRPRPLRAGTDDVSSGGIPSRECGVRSACPLERPRRTPRRHADERLPDCRDWGRSWDGRPYAERTAAFRLTNRGFSRQTAALGREDTR
jgi:hypothetical protein